MQERINSPNRRRRVTYGLSIAACVAGFGLALLVAGCPSADLPPTDLPASPSGDLLLRFAQISDVHVCDEESPARLVRFAPLLTSAWRPQEAYAGQVLDATLAVLNAHHTGSLTPQLPLDFMLVTGDLSDSGQLNELRRVIDTIDGKVVTPDSGAPDGGARQQPPDENPKLAYDAVGLNPSIPWYSVIGNHDGLAVGVFVVDRTAFDPHNWNTPVLGIIAQFMGLGNISPPSTMMRPTDNQSPARILGSFDPTDPVTFGLRLDLCPAGPIVPDDARRYSSKKQFVQEFYNTTSSPVGHGFDTATFGTEHPRYSTLLKKNVPIRLIALDTVAEFAPPGLPTQFGVLSREEFDHFLEPEIEAAQTAGEYVIIASHHPSSNFDLPTIGPKVSTNEFRNYLASQPNVLMHVCGHNHRNHLSLVDGTYPYYEIETDSLIDYPQEARIIEIYHDSGSNTFTIQSRMVSHMESPTTLSAESYHRAQIDAQNGRLLNLKDATATLNDMFGSQAKDAGVPIEPITQDLEEANTRTPEERKGSDSDRNFKIEVKRPLLH